MPMPALEPVARGAMMSQAYATFLDGMLDALVTPEDRPLVRRVLAILSAELRRQAEPGDLAVFQARAEDAGPERTSVFVRTLAAQTLLSVTEALAREKGGRHRGDE